MAGHAFIVDAGGQGARLDRFLADQAPMSRSQIRRHVEEGLVMVNGEPARPSRILKPGDRVEYSPPPPRPDTALPQPMPLTIVYEDDHLVVVDKPAGLVVHPAAGHPDKTLVNALLAHCGPLSSVGGRQRPGIVHRLDKDTSGILVATKTDVAHHHLSAQFQIHSVERAYLAVTVGAPPEATGTFETWHGRHPVHRKRFTTRLDRGRRAVTHYRVREMLGPLTLVEARLETGRTHQVRVHLAEHGAPLLGDPIYGRSPRDPALRQLARVLGRQALHAAILGIDHPVTGERLRWESPLPADMAAILEDARRSCAP